MRCVYRVLELRDHGDSQTMCALHSLEASLEQKD
jgi:hypothetical protein